MIIAEIARGKSLPSRDQTGNMAYIESDESDSEKFISTVELRMKGLTMKAKYSFLIGVLVLSLATMACSISLNLPGRVDKVGPLQTQEIVANVPSAVEARLELRFGAGELKLSPGADGVLVKGTATYNVQDLMPEIEVTGNEVVIKSGTLEINGIPRFNDDVRNEWNLQLGTVPLHLFIKAGAYKGEYELGGLALQELDIADGAADVDLKFTLPNLVEMDRLRYDTGASNVKLENLANANAKMLTFRSGAGEYLLDFHGELKRDCLVHLESGMSSVRLVVPEGTRAILTMNQSLAAIDMDGKWQKDGDQYFMDGEGPTLVIEVDMSAGNLELRN
jgi:hypothetical protein